MRQYPRVQDFNRDQVLRFNELRNLSKRGKIPAWLLNPSIILSHNECSPSVAQLHETSEVSLDSLAVLAVGAAEVGINARSAIRKALRQPRHIVGLEDEEVKIKHDPKTAKLHSLLDEKED